MVHTHLELASYLQDERGQEWEKQFRRQTRFTMLHTLATCDSVQAVQEYVNQPGFDPAELLMPCKEKPELCLSAVSPLVLTMVSPTFDVAGLLLQVRAK